MELYDAIRTRRSIRGYTPDPIPAEALERILEAADLAPTACNVQPFKLLLVESPEKRAAVCRCYTAPWLAEAPLIVVALGNRNTAWKRLDGNSAHVIDTSIVMEHVVLAATAEGLGTCWICAFEQGKLHRELGLDAEWDVVALTPLGVPKDTPGAQTRKGVEAVVERI